MADTRPRLFVAVPVADAARESCRALLEVVQRGPHGAGPNWVGTEKLHMTLRFLGPAPVERVGDVAAAVEAAAAGRPGFRVSLAGAGAFPSGARPRVLWLGMTEGAGPLGELVRALDGPLASLGWAPETRPFRPHLTVARTDSAPIAVGAAAAGALIEAAEGWRTSFIADRVVLYRSHLGRGPSRYEALAEVDLVADGS